MKSKLHLTYFLKFGIILNQINQFIATLVTFTDATDKPIVAVYIIHHDIE